MLTFALIGGVIGACSVLAGLTHLRAWRSDSLATATSSAITSWAITALDFGYSFIRLTISLHLKVEPMFLLICMAIEFLNTSLVCKEIILGGHRGKRLQTLEAFIAISTVSQLLYLLLLHSGMFNRRYGPTYGSHRTDYGRAHEPRNTGSSAVI
ncbi:hypothetical protein RJ639_033871 [Escallonia herrerae]|uniref:Uncharacterized protein n=1 Tax=Escallonia herrerae TaxID=1293975 RepID=A0AA89BG24_9ASTE|nr:hypothetical protein RJ639_033871 [Escallonia herrerae]